ncbi:hypothetical protein F5884DRAFT_791002 [Xylogone sp. PMI_703]|nr:hypothetical protein F5884DRAFT_791002 [Xylogone sp. PMI_703]
MHSPLHILLFVFSLLTSLPIIHAQAALGGGAPPPSPAPTQYPTTSIAPSLTTQPNGVVTTIWITFTQTFASTALGSWELGPTPLAGKIGL